MQRCCTAKSLCARQRAHRSQRHAGQRLGSLKRLANNTDARAIGHHPELPHTHQCTYHWQHCCLSLFVHMFCTCTVAFTRSASACNAMQILAIADACNIRPTPAHGMPVPERYNGQTLAMHTYMCVHMLALLHTCTVSYTRSASVAL
jgi:hypothetical protein